MDSKPPLTDSPWFWVLIFSLVALGAVAAIGPKYGRRQAVLERKYQSRERVAERLAPDSGQSESTAGNLSPRRRELASAENRLVPLWPLALILLIVVTIAAVMLYRDYRGRQPGSLEDETASP